MLRFSINSMFERNDFGEKGIDYLINASFNPSFEKELGLDNLALDEAYPFISVWVKDKEIEHVQFVDMKGIAKQNLEELKPNEAEMKMIKTFMERYVINE